MHSSETEKLRILHTPGSCAPGEGGGFVEEQGLRTELAALNAAFEAARMGREGEAFARSIAAILEKQRR